MGLVLSGEAAAVIARGQTGMTLVELLIVFSIVGLLVALVAPLTVRQMDKARGQEELLVLGRTVDTVAFRSFADGKSAVLTGRGTEFTWQFSGEAVQQLQLEQVFFDREQQVLINTSGFANQEGLTVTFGGRERFIKLNRWLEDEAR